MKNVSFGAEISSLLPHTYSRVRLTSWGPDIFKTSNIPKAQWMRHKLIKLGQIAEISKHPVLSLPSENLSSSVPDAKW